MQFTDLISLVYEIISDNADDRMAYNAYVITYSRS